MLFITAAWGACFLLIRLGLSSAPPLWFGALRGLVAGVALLGVAGIQHRPAPRGPRRWALVTVLGLTNVALAFGAMFVATAGIATATAAVITNAQPLLIAIPAWLLYGERVGRTTVLAIVLGLAGLAVVAGPGGGGSGASLALFAAVGITAGTLLIRKASGMDIVSATGWHFLIGGGALAVVAFAVEGPPAISWGPGFVALVLLLGIAGTAIPFLLWFEEALRVPLGQLTAWTFLVPVFGIAFRAVFLGEFPSGPDLVGIALVLASIGLVLRAGASPAASPPGRPARTPSAAVVGAEGPWTWISRARSTQASSHPQRAARRADRVCRIA